MQVITKALFAAAFITMPVVVALILVGQRADVPPGDWQGTLIYRQLDKYLRPPYVKPVLILSYLFVTLFIAAVASAIVIGLGG
jgi:hypothetical protein